jgi:hypothetical protein
MLSAVLTSAERFYKNLSSAQSVGALVGKSEDADFDCEEWPARRDDARRIIAKAACGLGVTPSKLLAGIA